MMQTIQLALSDSDYCEALRQALARDGGLQNWQVERVSVPDPEKASVLVIDSAGLDRALVPLHHPERVVLIARNTPEELTRAWEAGIVSVIFDYEPLSTAMLAILAARYRAWKFLG